MHVSGYLNSRNNDATAVVNEIFSKFTSLGGGLYCADLGYCIIVKDNETTNSPYCLTKRYNNNERLQFPDFLDMVAHILQTYW